MSDLQPSQRYVLSDIDIPFFRLIVIFVKWSLAAVPAEKEPSWTASSASSSSRSPCSCSR